MDIKQVFGLLAALSSVANLALYIRSILRGKTRPHAFSWILWTIVMSIVCAAQLAGGAGAGAWGIGASDLMCAIIAVLSLMYGERHGTKTDWASMLVALAAIPLWIITKNPLASVVLLTCMDALAYYPMLRKGYLLPYEEDLYRPFRAVVTFLFAALAVEYYSFVTALYPVAMMGIEFSCGMILLYRRRVIPQPSVRRPNE